MARVFKNTICALAAACALFGTVGTARAVEPVTVTRAPAAEPSRVRRPDRALLSSGLWTLGLSYVPAFVVAVESPRSFDNHLYIPVAGPWLDYGKRSCVDCKNETVNKVLLVTDGVFQGIGALQILGAFLFPETHTSTTTDAAKDKPRRTAGIASVRVVPSRFETGAYGLTAKARFF
ncbi:MAG TPA: hypothetical protein VFQ61_06005 [Polyangiaceae bacterium]|nr:hypothetical protein [Polyangiaceae bacterium]